MSRGAAAAPAIGAALCTRRASQLAAAPAAPSSGAAGYRLCQQDAMNTVSLSGGKRLADAAAASCRGMGGTHGAGPASAVLVVSGLFGTRL